MNTRYRQKHLWCLGFTLLLSHMFERGAIVFHRFSKYNSCCQFGAMSRIMLEPSQAMSQSNFQEANLSSLKAEHGETSKSE